MDISGSRNSLGSMISPGAVPVASMGALLSQLGFSLDEAAVSSLFSWVSPVNLRQNSPAPSRERTRSFSSSVKSAVFGDAESDSGADASEPPAPAPPKGYSYSAFCIALAVGGVVNSALRDPPPADKDAAALLSALRTSLLTWTRFDGDGNGELTEAEVFQTIEGRPGAGGAGAAKGRPGAGGAGAAAATLSARPPGAASALLSRQRWSEMADAGSGRITLTDFLLSLQLWCTGE
jgi:hypothetical protein